MDILILIKLGPKKKQEIFLGFFFLQERLLYIALRNN
jgi:hypothetical protein